MATPTYELIDSVTLTSSASSVILSGIPQTYGDLVMSIDIPTTSDFGSIDLQFNQDTSGGYSFLYMRGYNTSVLTGSNTGVGYVPNGYLPTGYRGLFVININDYSSTDRHKTILSRVTNMAFGVWLYASRWPSTAGINEIKIATIGTPGNYPVGTIINLYGIAKAL